MDRQELAVKYKDFNLLIGTPCFGGTVVCEYLSGLLGLLATGIKATCSVLVAESLVTRARNTIVATFLSNPSFTHLLFIDADIGFQSEAVLRLLDAGKPVVSAVYPRKTLDWEAIRRIAPHSTGGQDLQEKSLTYVVNVSEMAAHETLTVENGFLKVLDAPTGFMLIERRVFEILRDKYPELHYEDDQPHRLQSGASSENFWLFFDTMVDPNTKRYLSEDYAFCRRWQNAGGEIWVDLCSPLVHVGRYAFSGNISKQFTYSISG